MKFRTIADIFKANDAIRAQLVETVGQLGSEEANIPTENGKWTIQGIVEHLSKVEQGMTAISAKLLLKSESEGKTSDGSAQLSDNFIDGLPKIVDTKLEAPEVVSPTGTKTISESLRDMLASRANLHELRQKFESVDGTEHKFQHPYLGELSAQDWLALIGAHEARHLSQIEKLLAD